MQIDIEEMSNQWAEYLKKASTLEEKTNRVKSLLDSNPEFGTLTWESRGSLLTTLEKSVTNKSLKKFLKKQADQMSVLYVWELSNQAPKLDDPVFQKADFIGTENIKKMNEFGPEGTQLARETYERIQKDNANHPTVVTPAKAVEIKEGGPDSVLDLNDKFLSSPNIKKLEELIRSNIGSFYNLGMLHKRAGKAYIKIGFNNKTQAQQAIKMLKIDGNAVPATKGERSYILMDRTLLSSMFPKQEAGHPVLEDRPLNEQENDDLYELQHIVFRKYNLKMPFSHIEDGRICIVTNENTDKIKKALGLKSSIYWTRHSPKIGEFKYIRILPANISKMIERLQRLTGGSEAPVKQSQNDNNSAFI